MNEVKSPVIDAMAHNQAYWQWTLHTAHTHTHTLPPDSGVQLYDVKIAPTVCLGALSGNAHFVKCKRHLKNALTATLSYSSVALWRVIPVMATDGGV